ncbi:MAG: hypothetical protein IPL08_10880 [Saprospiraceae bacterium]|nr:hypothetical protein [Saprospiraceae bacterium]
MKIFICFMCSVYLLFITGCTGPFATSDESDSGNEVAVGSYSTMIVLANKLYAVTDTKIFTFDISNTVKPQLMDSQDIGSNIESLFHYNGLLFVGSANNMFIYTLDTSGIPRRESTSQYHEVWGPDICNSDPIVARSNIAYVTLSTTNSARCFAREINELRIYNISDIRNPALLSILEMSKPKGLGLGKKKLYICDENLGLIVFDIKDPSKPVQEKIFDGYPAYDLIVKNDLLIVSSARSLYQYDISDENNIRLLSKIEL